jgi:hypothetical protein
MVDWHMKIDNIGLRDIADLSEKCFLNSAYEELVCFNVMLSYYRNVTYVKTDDKIFTLMPIPQFLQI